MSGITDMPIRVCPWPGCRAVWVEDPNMYEDTDRCPECGRFADAFVLRDDVDLFDWIGGGGDARRQIIYTESAGPMLQENGKWLVTEQNM